MNAMGLIDVVRKLAGPIRPIGETREDESRYKNLEAIIDLVDLLLDDIEEVSINKSRQEHSMKKAGDRANDFLLYVKEMWKNWAGSRNRVLQ